MRAKLFFVMFIAASCCNVAFSQNTTEDIKRLWIRVQTAYSMGEYEDALAECLKIKQIAPGYPDIYKTIGDVYEKLGSDENLINAINSYKEYLRLSPNAEDKEAMQTKIYQLEYISDKQIKQTQILDDFKGLWVSDIKDKNGNPFVIFNFTEIAREGRFRVEMLPASGFYNKKSIIQKVVSVVPDRKNTILFTFADAQTYNPSSAKYDLLGFGLQMLSGSISSPSLISNIGTVGQIGINAAAEKDLPTSTQTTYTFKLQYQNGKMEGYCIIQQLHNNSKIQQETQNDYFEITLTKEDGFLYKKGKHIVDATGKHLSKEEFRNTIKDYPNLFKKYKTYKIIPALIPIGAVGLITGLSMPSDIDIRYLITGVGACTTVLGITLTATKRSRILQNIANEYNEEIRLNNKTGKKQGANLNFGITPSGGVGLVLNY